MITLGKVAAFLLLSFSIDKRGGTTCFQAPAISRRNVVENNVSRKAKLSKQELASIVTGMGLNPVRVQNVNKSSSERRRRRNQIFNQTSNYKNPHEKHHMNSLEIPLETQLEYSRNGSAVLRSWYDPALIRSIKSDLIAYSKRKELDAWRQKVEVARNIQIQPPHDSLHSIAHCKKELAALGMDISNLPFLQYFNTWRHVASVKNLCFSLGHAASVLMDVPSVRLYQDALFHKRAGDGPTRWHVDARMAPFDTSHMITFWIPLQNIPKDGTALLFVPKSHNDFALPFWNTFHGPEFERLEQRYSYQTVDYMPLSIGDITVHSGWTLHSASENRMQNDRLALAITFVDATAQVRDTALEFSPSSSGGGYGDNEDQQSYREWLGQVPRRKPFGTHPLVPIVWPLLFH